MQIDERVLQELKDCCKLYFNACALLLDKITPTVWTIGYVIPYHSELLYNKYGLGLGINTMQGREAKHVRVAQYAKHATLTTRWKSVLKHDYITSVWLWRQDPMSVSYHKCKEVYEPQDMDNMVYCYCGLDKTPGNDKCAFCSSDLYQSIANSARAGKLDHHICNMLSVLS